MDMDTLLTKVCIVKAMAFPAVVYGHESWAIKKAKLQRIDAFELWCWRKLLRVPWTARRPNQSILKEIDPEYSLGGFLDISVGKESTCNVGDPGLIPGLGRSPGERKGYPLQYSWASLVAQLVKNLPAMPETWVQSLGWEDPLAKGKGTHPSILAWRIPWAV